MNDISKYELQDIIAKGITEGLEETKSRSRQRFWDVMGVVLIYVAMIGVAVFTIAIVEAAT